MKKGIALALLALSTLAFQQQAYGQATPVPPIIKTKGHTQDVTALIVSPDGKHLFSASRDNTIRMMTSDSGTQVKSFQGHGSVVSCLGISDDGKLIISGSDDGSVMVWDVETGNKVNRVVNHQGTVTGVAISKEGGNRYFYTTAEDGTIKVYDRNLTGKIVRTINVEGGPVKAMTMEPHGNSLLVAGADGKLRRYSAKEDALLLTLEGGHASPINALAISPDGAKAATASDDRTIQIWDLKENKSIQTLKGHSWKVLSVSWNQSMEYLASGSNDGSVKVWNAQDGSVLKSYELKNRRTFYAVQFSPDSRFIIAGQQIMKPMDPGLDWWETGLTAKEPVKYVRPVEPVQIPAAKPKPKAPKKK